MKRRNREYLGEKLIPTWVTPPLKCKNAARLMSDGIRNVEPAGIEPASISGLSGLLRAEPVIAFLGPGSLTGTLLTGPAT